jgi:hypothetical protein
LLVAVEEHQEIALAAARRALLEKDLPAVARHAEAAARLRADGASMQLQAIAALSQRDFARALAFVRCARGAGSATSETPG